MQRSIDQWAQCDPKAMANQSQAAIAFAFEDAKADIAELHAALDVLTAEGTEARVIAMIAERQKMGIKKYGTTVSENQLPLLGCVTP